MILHIVGNRPQFIKLAPVSKEIRKRGYKEVIIHTGQHYDENMSDIFFRELDIPNPNENLLIGSGTHAEMTGTAMIRIEKTLEKYEPQCVILYGDTDSTLAGALATAKMNIPIVHIEAGVRTNRSRNPEEINRIVVDHLSELLFCSDKDSENNLKREGLGKNAVWVGDVMYDTFLQFQHLNDGETISPYGVKKDEYVLLTWHRQENTESRDKMLQIINFLKEINYKIICPLHPRTRKKLQEFNLIGELEKIPNALFITPVGYIEMIKLMINAHIILTDSGGVSKESFFAGVKCILMVDLDIWPDLIKNQWITKLDFDSRESVDSALRLIRGERQEKNGILDFYGKGDASARILDILEKKYTL